MVEVVVKALKGGGTQMPKNWNRRFKHNRDKMKTGDVLELAEVVRNLSLRDHEKGLSTGEKQMFVKAKKILASELMYAKGMDDEEAAEWLEDVLSNVGANGGRSDHPREGRRRRQLVLHVCPGRCSPLQEAASGSGWTARRRSRTLRDRPLLAESLERLEGSDWIDSIVVAAPAGLGGARDPARRGARRRQGRRLVTGGATRAESVRAGVAEVPDDASAIVVHDAARPLVATRSYRARPQAARRGLPRRGPGAARRRHDQARAGRRGRRDGRPRRLVAVQTPQAFLADTLRSALGGDVSEATDCSSLVEAAGGRVAVVEGDHRLLKVTEPADLELVEALLSGE